MSNTINQQFTTKSLLRFALPSIIMMMFMSLYSIVDGIFVSRFAGSNALSSLNIVYPIPNIIIALGTMLSTGGNAVISLYLGQGKKKEARECLTLFTVVGVVISIFIMIVALIFTTPLCYALGADETLLADCQTYLQVLMLFSPACVLQTLFQSYLVTAERSNLGLGLTVAAGLLNAVLDYVFIAIFHMGIGGAALATGLGQMLPAVAGVIFFFVSKKDLHFDKFRLRLRELGKACYNGSSEMIGQLSNAVITFLFNIVLMRLVGAPGVAAVTILLYGQFLFNAFNMGYAIGISPIIGFQYGAGDKAQLKKVYKISMIFVAVASIVLTLLSIFGAEPLVSIFTKDQATFTLAVAGFGIFAFNFLFSGINIISSGIFTALSNGKVSAIISFARTLVFIVICLLTLPNIFGVNGVWVAVPVAEFLTLILCLFMHYQYFWKKGPKNYFI